MVQASAEWFVLWQTVGLSVLILFLVAVVWSRIIPGMLHYPVKWMDKSPPTAWWGGWDDNEV
jgi:hypothetical protein